MLIIVGFCPPLQFGAGARDQDRKISPAKWWETDKGGHRRPKRKEVKSEEKRREFRRENKCRGKTGVGDEW